MQVIAPKTPALLASCDQCGALLAFTFNDIYESCYIYCPVCKQKIKTNLDMGYDGVVKEKK